MARSRTIALIAVALLLLGAGVFFLPVLLDEHGFVPEETADLMRNSLRGPMDRQDEYFAAHGSYSDTITIRPAYDEEIRYEIREATRTGYSIVASHPRMRGIVCGVFVGDARPVLRHGGTAGEPDCGGPAER